jgi:hypothetical protein
MGLMQFILGLGRSTPAEAESEETTAILWDDSSEILWDDTNPILWDNTVWILAEALWDDAGVWDDNDIWIDVAV